MKATLSHQQIKRKVYNCRDIFDFLTHVFLLEESKSIMLDVQSEGTFSLKLFPECNNLVILQFCNFVTVFCESVLAYLSFYQKYHSNSELNNQTQSLSMAGGGTENVKSFTIPLPGEKYLTMTLILGISTDFIRFAAEHCQEIRR